MDGNGRWARKRGLPRAAGHKAGAKAVKRAIEAADELGIKYLTLYAFSVENWSRPQDEISGLMQLLVDTLRSELNAFHEKNIRLNLIGRWRELESGIVEELQKALDKTANNTAGVLTLALNYGGRAEITDAARAIAGEAAAGNMDPALIDERILNEHMSTAGLPDPDLLIRTSGEMRVSNFLLWQIAYTEFWVTDDFWPDFDRTHMIAAVSDFQKRRRTFGGLKEGD
jgi:undecaprenyl diphosphate synthase